MVKFKVPRVGRIPECVGPGANATSIVVPHQDLPAYVVGDVAIMFGCLAILFEHVYADCQIWATARLGCNGPPVLCPQFSNPPRPVTRIFGYVGEFFTKDRATQVFPKVFKDTFPNSNVSIADAVGNMPTAGRIGVCSGINEEVVVWLHPLKGCGHVTFDCFRAPFLRVHQ
jgi:hypothetical protein